MDPIKRNSGLGIAGMIVGIISILLSCILVGGFLGTIGLALSIVGVTQKNVRRGLPIAGIVLNALAILFMIVFIASGMISFNPSEEPSANITASSTVTVEKEVETSYATMDKFNQIKTGMTYDEVVAIIGSEGTLMSETAIMDTTTAIYSWYGWDGISNMNVTLTNGVVVSKAQLGLK